MNPLNIKNNLPRVWLPALFIVLLGLLAIFVNGLRQQFQNELIHAGANTLNLARVLESHTAAVFNKADTLLQHIADEITPPASGEGIQQEDVQRYLIKLKKTLPEVLLLRVVGPDGHALADSTRRLNRVYCGDHPHFQRLRDNPLLELDVSDPIQGRVFPVPQIVLSRRINDVNGEFAGVVSAFIPLSYFDQLFRTVDLGKDSNITLLNQNLVVIARQPHVQRSGPVSVQGSSLASQLAKNPVEGSFTGKSTVDGVERVVSYARVENLPFIVVVGQARSEVLAGWRAIAVKDGLAMAGLLIAISLLIFHLLRVYAQERQARTMLREIAATLGEGVYVLDQNGLVTFVNPEAERLLGWSAEELIGRNGHDLFHYQRPDGTHLAYADCPVHQAIRTGQTYRMLNDWIIRKDGTILPISMVSSPLMRGGRIVGSVAAFQDITPLLAAEEQIRQLAYHDSLTNLPNRRLLLDRLDQALSQARRHQRALALMFLDLDHFKEINDTLGHDVGDELLKQVAARLEDAIRGGDTVSRQGGDEFVVLLADIAQAQDAILVADKILRALRLPITVGDHNLRISASIGIASYPADGADDPKELMKKADIALYAAKKAGRDKYRFYGDGSR